MQLFKNIESEIIKNISQSSKSIKIAVTWFTNKNIYQALIDKLADSNYKLEIVVLNDKINNKKEGVNFQKLIDLNADFYYSEIESMVHHKFCIIDDKKLITGSYNWTYYAENRNWENVLIIKDSKILSSFINEFEKIKKHFPKIENIANTQKQMFSLNSSEYLETDYMYQAKDEKQAGNELKVAKIYTEILKLNINNKEIASAQKRIIHKYNSQQFTVCPFEIGIEFENGYHMAIPAFEELPFTVKRVGKIVDADQTSVLIIIQKLYLSPLNIARFTLDNIMKSPIGTEKVEYHFTLEKSGILSIVCKELNGYGREVTKNVDIKNWL